jgi:hypothetical protein
MDPSILQHPANWASYLRPSDGVGNDQRSSTPSINKEATKESNQESNEEANKEAPQWGGDQQPDLNEQYALAKQFYLHGLSQTKITQRLALSNLAYQEQLTKSDVHRAVAIDQQQMHEQAVRDTSPFSRSMQSTSAASTSISRPDYLQTSALLSSSALRQQSHPSPSPSPSPGARYKVDKVNKVDKGSSSGGTSSSPFRRGTSPQINHEAAGIDILRYKLIDCLLHEISMYIR